MTKATTFLNGIGWPEAPRWHDGRLVFTDIYGTGRVFSVTEDGNRDEGIAIDGEPSGTGWLPDGRMLVVSMKGCKVLVVDQDDTVSTHADLAGIATCPNDMIVAADGRAYVGDNGFFFGQTPFEKGRILMVDPDGSASVVAEGLGLPNGMSISPDGKTLTIGETLGGRLSEFDILADGRLGDRRTRTAFDDIGIESDMAVVMTRDCAPDGICRDADGNIWVGNPLRPFIDCVAPNGTVVERVELSQPGIACTLGGKDGRTLFVATGMLGDNSGTGKIETATVGVASAGLQ